MTPWGDPTVAGRATVLDESPAIPREWLCGKRFRILYLVAEGKTTRETAAELDASIRDVANIVQAWLEALDVRSRGGLAVRALQLELLSLGDLHVRGRDA